jgi:DNA-binding CsgD family transcriptional regulator
MRRRDDPMLQRVLLLLADIARNVGRWDDADAYIKEAYELVIQTGRQAVEPECLTATARMAMLRGEVELAERLANDALAVLADVSSAGERRAILDGRMIQALVSSIIARGAQMADDHARAHRLLLEACEHDREIGMCEWLVEGLAADVTSLLALGERDEAARTFDELQRASESVTGELQSASAALVARAEGLLAAADGDYGSAIVALQRSRDLVDACNPWPYERARTLLALGRVQRRARRKAEARNTLEQALAIFDELGSKLWAQQARDELDQLGGRRSERNGLTETEARVAAVVALGRSNAEAARELFMSPKTVEWNLSKIYKKLHVRSRAELAAKLAKRPQS